MTSLSAIDEQLLQIARQHGRVTLSSALMLTNVNRNTLKLHLRQLVEAGHLRLLGRGRSSWYEMVVKPRRLFNGDQRQVGPDGFTKTSKSETFTNTRWAERFWQPITRGSVS